MAETWLCVKDPAGPPTAQALAEMLAFWDAPDPAADPNIIWTPWGSCPREAS